MPGIAANIQIGGSGFPFTTVLVTGGAGFIGSRVVRILRGLSCRVIALDDESIGLPLPPPDDFVVPVEADIRDASKVRDVLSAYQPPAIMHLAAIHHIPTCEKNPRLAFDANVMGTQILLDEAAAAGIENVLLASSGAVYDWVDGALAEDRTPLRARDVYSTTKLANEYQVATWADRCGARAHVARIFNTIGMNDPNAHLIPDLLEQLRGEGDEIVVRLGNVAPKRDYLHVDDTAGGLVTILAGMQDGPQSEIFNLCRGDELSVAELVDKLADIIGKTVIIEHDASRMRRTDRLQQLGDPTKMKRCFGWTARATVREALASIAEGYGLSTREEASEAARVRWA